MNLYTLLEGCENMSRSLSKYFLTTLIAVFVLSLGCATPDEVSAKKNNKKDKQKSKGAVKTAIKQRKPGDYALDAGSGKRIGFVIATATASNRLEVNIHLQNGHPNQEYNVWVKQFPNGKSTNHLMKQFGDLKTNKQGKANSHYKRPLPDRPDRDDDGDIEVQVVLKRKGQAGIVGAASRTFPVVLK